jgi:endonuclease I
MNNHRASLHFGKVVAVNQDQRCSQNKLGQNAEGETVFEVPDSQKGNTARAIFYFATRYKMKMSATEEAALREWDKQDPVDAEEFTQNNQIDQLQGNRNPFIDFSDLLDRIEHF